MPAWLMHWGVPEWNLLLNIIVTVLVIGYGIWLRSVIEQKDKAKDATIESLKTTIETKDHQIKKLEADALPSVATAYKGVKEYADEVSKANVELTAKIGQIESGKKYSETSLKIQGLQIATGIISKRLQEMPQTYLTATKRVYFAGEMLGLLNSVIADIGKSMNELLGSNPFGRIGSGIGVLEMIKDADVPVIVLSGEPAQLPPSIDKK